MSATDKRWPLERVLFALAGSVALVSGVLAVLLSRWFGLLALFVGANQWLYVMKGSCPASILLRRTCRLQSAIYENRDRATVRAQEVTA